MACPYFEGLVASLSSKEMVNPRLCFCYAREERNSSSYSSADT